MDTSDEDPSNQLPGNSITYRIALGPQQGRKVFTLQTLPDVNQATRFPTQRVRLPGFRFMRVLQPKLMSVKPRVGALRRVLTYCEVQYALIDGNTPFICPILSKWDNRIEQRRERKQLVSMRAEFEASLLGLDEVLTSIQGHAQNIEDVIQLRKTAGGEPVLIPGPLLGSAIIWRRFDVSISTLNALMSSGDLNLLDNVALRTNLAGFPAFLLNVTEDEVIAQNFAEREMSIFLAREGLAEIAYANRGGVPGPEGIQGLSAPVEIYVKSSPELTGLLTARRVHFLYSEEGLPTVRSYLEELIGQIDNELVTK